MKLHLRVERSTHRHAAAVKRILAIKPGELPAYFLGEILGRIKLRSTGPRNDVEVFVLVGARFRQRDVAIFGHPIENPVPPLDCRLGPPERMIVRRSLGQRREIGRFGIGQLVKRLVEIVERGSGNPIGIEAEENLVEIKFEDFVLGERIFDPQRQQRFLDLAVPGLVRGQKEVLGDLLGNRRRADQIAGIA